jgi:predicted helicase
LVRGEKYSIDLDCIVEASYRPFHNQLLYFNSQLNEVQYQTRIFGEDGRSKNSCIIFTDASSQKPFMVTSTSHVFDYHYVGAAAAASGVPRYRYAPDGTRFDNLTDWSLGQFSAHYESGKKPKRPITKDAIFHYVYGVLHDPVYRGNYLQNLKRESPRTPLYSDFWKWADWGEKLMALHIGYETVKPWKLKRIDVPDEKSKKANLAPKPSLKADKNTGVIMLDSETQLTGVPPEAWSYKLGNRSALEWILDQHKEKRSKDSTIRAKFNTYRFADHTEKVIDLLMRVSRVSVETMEIVEAMKNENR